MKPTSALWDFKACASVLIAQNSTPFTDSAIIRFTAFPPAPPTPKTLIEHGAPLDGSIPLPLKRQEEVRVEDEVDESEEVTKANDEDDDVLGGKNDLPLIFLILIFIFIFLVTLIPCPEDDACVSRCEIGR